MNKQTETDLAAELPVYARPLREAGRGDLEFELALRRGPQWRCSGCGWLFAGSYAAVAPACPGKTCQGAQSVQRWRLGVIEEWKYAAPGRVRDWYLAVAGRCGLPGLVGAVPENLSGETEQEAL